MIETPKHPPLGGKRDADDSRDLRYSPPVATAPLPAAVDLRSGCGEVYYQLPLQSCSANALSSMLTFVGNVEKRPIPPPSRLFIYYNTRKLDGTLPADGGATIRNAIKAVAKTGSCSETLWPYDATKAADEPPAPCYDDARSTRALQYFRLTQDLDHLRGCLAEGYAFMFGMQIYNQSFAAAQTSGVLEMPKPGETVMGGHAVLVIGYDHTAQTFTVLNSLGAKWGSAGYFTIPYAFMTDATLAYDFWTIRSVS